MSGGAFNYRQHAIFEIIDQMSREMADPDFMMRYSEDVMERFREGIKALRIAYVHAQRADWLLSGDDGPESYIERLAEELAEIEEKP